MYKFKIGYGYYDDGDPFIHGCHVFTEGCYRYLYAVDLARLAIKQIVSEGGQFIICELFIDDNCKAIAKVDRVSAFKNWLESGVNGDQNAA